MLEMEILPVIMDFYSKQTTKWLKDLRQRFIQELCATCNRSGNYMSTVFEFKQ